MTDITAIGEILIDLTQTDVSGTIFAARSAGLTCSRSGAIPAMLTLAELEGS